MAKNKKKIKAGVFSPCDSLDIPSMIKYLQVLHSNYPSIKINSIQTVKKHRGFKFFFSEPEVSIVLQKNQLSSEGQTISIYPLTAYLIILDVDQKKTPLPENELRKAMKEKIGNVLEVVKTKNFNKNKDWRIQVDVPECRNLGVFKRPYITLPIPGRNIVTLQLCCKQCELTGHFQHECTFRFEEETQREPEMRNESDGQLRENCTERDVSFPGRISERTPESCKVPVEASVRYAERTGGEEVTSSSKETERHTQNKTIKEIWSNINRIILTKKRNEFPALQNDIEITKAPDDAIVNKASSHATNSSSVENYIKTEFSAFQDDNEITKAPANSTTNYPSSDATNSSTVEKYIRREVPSFQDNNEIKKGPDNFTVNKPSKHAKNSSAVEIYVEKEVPAFPGTIKINKVPAKSTANYPSSHATNSLTVEIYIEKEVPALQDDNKISKAPDYAAASSHPTNSSTIEKCIKREVPPFQNNNEKAPDNSTANKPSSHTTNSSTVEKYIKKEAPALPDDNEITKSPANSTANRSSSLGTYSTVESRNFEQPSSTSFLERGRADSSTFSPSGSSGHPRRRNVIDTSVLSETLQDCINQACDRVGVLDREKLDVFLRHAKNHPCPSELALRYTKNANGLKLQLEYILNGFYNITPTKNDKYFIDWLSRLIERYDGKKRKRDRESDNEPEHPAKK